jgi:hypothetical protein
MLKVLTVLSIAVSAGMNGGRRLPLCDRVTIIPLFLTFFF